MSEIVFFRRGAELRNAETKTLNDDNAFHRYFWRSSTIPNDFSAQNLVIPIKTPSIDSADGLIPHFDPSII